MVTGGSYGGYMTLAVATHYSDRIRCARRRRRHLELRHLPREHRGYRRDLRRVEYGDERDPKMREFLEKIAPLNNAAKITKPLFVVQGTQRPARAAHRGRADGRDGARRTARRSGT